MPGNAWAVATFEDLACFSRQANSARRKDWRCIAFTLPLLQTTALNSAESSKNPTTKKSLAKQLVDNSKVYKSIEGLFFDS
jgi:hypothetical protein